MFSRPSTQAFKKSAVGCVSDPSRIRSAAVILPLPNLRMVIEDPSIAAGAMTAFTRDPSGRRASTIGHLASIRRPSGLTICSNHFADVIVIAKTNVGFRHDALALGVNEVWSVDHDFGDGRIIEQRLNRTKMRRFTHQFWRRNGVPGGA